VKYTVTVSGGVYWLATGGAAALQQPSITFSTGLMYVFDQSHVSNFGNTLVLGQKRDEIPYYTTNVVTNGTAGSADAYTLIDLSGQTLPSPALKYFSGQTSEMGWMLGQMTTCSIWTQTGASYMKRTTHNSSLFTGCIVCSQDGTYVVVSNSDNISPQTNLSSDGGITFRRIDGVGNLPVQNPNSVGTGCKLYLGAISDTGQYIYISSFVRITDGYKFNVWKSSDFGTTWNSVLEIITGEAIKNCSCSGLGDKIIVSVSDGIYYSTNYGNSFTRIGQGTSGNNPSASVSGNGKYWVYTIGNTATSGFNMFLSIDNCVSWTTIRSTNVGEQANILKITNTGNIYYNNNSYPNIIYYYNGTTWIDLYNVESGSYILQMQTNASGSVLFTKVKKYVVNVGYIFSQMYSLDNGKNFTNIPNTTVFTTSTNCDFAVSSSGNCVYAVQNSDGETAGYIYKSIA
jgi:hypothetical protein